MQFACPEQQRESTVDRDHDDAEAARSEHLGPIGPAEVAVDDGQHCGPGEGPHVLVDVTQELATEVDHEDARAEALLRHVAFLALQELRPAAARDGSCLCRSSDREHGVPPRAFHLLDVRGAPSAAPALRRRHIGLRYGTVTKVRRCETDVTTQRGIRTRHCAAP